MIDSVAVDLKERLRENPLDEQFSGTNKFIDRYSCYSSCKSNPMLASALHKFGWVFGGSVTSQKFGRCVMENELLFKPQLLADAERSKKGKLLLYLETACSVCQQCWQIEIQLAFGLRLGQWPLCVHAQWGVV